MSESQEMDVLVVDAPTDMSEVAETEPETEPEEVVVLDEEGWGPKLRHSDDDDDDQPPTKRTPAADDDGDEDRAEDRPGVRLARAVEHNIVTNIRYQQLGAMFARRMLRSKLEPLSYFQMDASDLQKHHHVGRFLPAPGMLALQQFEFATRKGGRDRVWVSLVAPALYDTGMETVDVNILTEDCCVNIPIGLHISDDPDQDAVWVVNDHVMPVEDDVDQWGRLSFAEQRVRRERHARGTIQFDTLGALFAWLEEKVPEAVADPQAFGSMLVARNL